MCRFIIKMSNKSYYSDNTQCYAYISNTHNISFNHQYLACNQCLEPLSYITNNFFKTLYQWVPILLEKEAWNDIELLVNLSLNW